MRIRITASVFGVGAVFLLAGCSGGETGSAAPPKSSVDPAGSSSGRANGQALPYAGAPKVAEPLSSSVLSSGPCAALTPQQVKTALGVDAQGRSDTLPGIGPKCIWDNLERGAKVTVYYVTETGRGLSGLYENTKPQAAVWKPLPGIQGFPAVAYVASTGGDPREFCAVSVGIADNLTVETAVSLGESKIGKADPCAIAPKEADAVVTTLRAKAGA
ncbi:DUF3558 domain-containing protein [Amycolatopsis sp. NPDC058986]|uniref:DUF3558 domain-containing protein n=1 Tax=unclassified Amycolatopsis TaxID=2618356 RepID=UPI0036713ED3